MSNKVSKNALGKVAGILQVVYVSLSTAVMLLNMYAPTQRQLIETLDYIQRVIRAVLEQSVMPRVPVFLQADSELGEVLEENEAYARVTRDMADAASDDLVFGSEGWSDDDTPRTK